MDYKKLIKALKCDGYGVGQDGDGCTNKRCKYRDSDGACNIVSMCEDAATAITDLLARAEAAEARVRELETSFRTEKCENGPECAELGRARKRAEAAEARAEKAERERDAAVSDLETVMAYGGGNLDTCQFCKNGQCYVRGGTKPCIQKWRGQKEE